MSGGNIIDSGSESGSVAENDPKKMFTADSTNEHCRRWEQMFTRLLEFRDKNGHCLVPNRYAEDPQLGAWVATQRRLYKLKFRKPDEPTPLTPEREKRLLDIGFEWSAENPRCVPWENRFVQLLYFVVENGHSQVPIGWEQNVQLANWVSMQRQEYKSSKKGFSSRLTQDRIDLLNKVGFVWEAKRGGPKRLRAGKWVPNPDSTKEEPTAIEASSRCYRETAKSLLKLFVNVKGVEEKKKKPKVSKTASAKKSSKEEDSGDDSSSHNYHPQNSKSPSAQLMEQHEALSHNNLAADGRFSALARSELAMARLAMLDSAAGARSSGSAATSQRGSNIPDILSFMGSAQQQQDAAAAATAAAVSALGGGSGSGSGSGGSTSAYSGLLSEHVANLRARGLSASPLQGPIAHHEGRNTHLQQLLINQASRLQSTPMSSLSSFPGAGGLGGSINGLTPSLCHSLSAMGGNGGINSSILSNLTSNAAVGGSGAGGNGNPFLSQTLSQQLELQRAFNAGASSDYLTQAFLRNSLTGASASAHLNQGHVLDSFLQQQLRSIGDKRDAAEADTDNDMRQKKKQKF